MDQHYRIGQFAQRAGVTVRALHHYDQVGLLRPSLRSANGYRLYGDSDLVRLQQIITLKALGLDLEAITAILDVPGFNLREALRAQISLLEEKRRGIEAALTAMREAERHSSPNDPLRLEMLVHVIEVTIAMRDLNYTSYFSPEQLEKLNPRGFSDQDQVRVSESWKNLLADIAAEKDGDAASPQAQKLVDRWDALVGEFTQGDPEMEESLRNVYRDPENKAKAFEVMPTMGEAAIFIDRARAARKTG
ncbi:MAG: MerR family transcriptional regulator [Candidatus Eremiobacteraeota bacterium]|nr:MerR family transcriptional regulator [Candidatus Eremiobacteraeota bacterium]